MQAQAASGEIVRESGDAHEDKVYALEAARRFGPADAEIEVEDQL
jgi:cellobiose-specific phosphotransferase system component IIA